MKVKRGLKSLFAVVLAIAIVLSAMPTESRAASTAAAINKTKATVYAGNTIKLKVTGVSGKVTWKTNNSAVAKVDKNGKVTGKKAGKATITAKSNKQTFKCQVTVKKVDINKKKLTLMMEKSYILKIGGVKTSKIKWSSKDKKIATVDKYGRVIPKKPGNTTVIGKVGKKQYKCIVTVVKYDDGLDYDDKVKTEELKEEKNVTVVQNPSAGSSVGIIVEQNANTEQIKPGDIVEVPDGNGGVQGYIKVAKVTDGSTGLNIDGNVPEFHEIFDKIDINEELDALAGDFVPEPGVVSSAKMTNLKGKDINSGFNNPGISYEYTIPSLNINIKIEDYKVDFALVGEATLTNFRVDLLKCNIKGDFIASSNVFEIKTAKKAIKIGKIPINIGPTPLKVEVLFYLTPEGKVEATINATFNMDVGYKYTPKSGAVATNNSDINFDVSATGNATLEFAVGVGVGAGVGPLGVEGVAVKLGFGPGIEAKATTYKAGIPKVCIDLSAYFFLNFGIDPEYGVGNLIPSSFPLTIQLLKNNTKNPFRFTGWHLEDFKRTPGDKCSRDTDDSLGSDLYWDAKEISCGHQYTAILKKNGNLWMAGYNNKGQLGTGDKALRTKFDLVRGKTDAVSAGQEHTLILANGDVYAVGDNRYGQLGDPILGDGVTEFKKIMSGVEKIYARGNHSAAITKTGDLYVWGQNTNGELGTGTVGKQTRPVKVAEKVDMVSFGKSHMAVMLMTAELFMSGLNNKGQFGNPDIKSSKELVYVKGAIDKVECGDQSTFVISTDTLLATGYNANGALGLGDRSNRKEFTEVMKGVKDIRSGNNHVAIIKTDNSLWTCGNNTYGQLGNGTTNSTTEFVSVGKKAKMVSCGTFHTGFITDSALQPTLYMMGRNQWGQFGDGSQKSSNTPTIVTAD